jgi:amino acid adenylation domain-containing protein
MSSLAPLHSVLTGPASHYPNKVAVVDPGRATITYRELDRLSDRVRDRLKHLGVQPGDRVGIYMRKSVDAIASIFGILKASAAYVPVDPSAPPARCAYILDNCAVTVILADHRLAPPLETELKALGRVPPMLLLPYAESGIPLEILLEAEDRQDPADVTETTQSPPTALAYILYTSGSTGRPKGVMLSHQAATSFVAWCSDTFRPNPEDRFSSHAPLHFDLSILDLYLPLKHGATLVLIGEEEGKDPHRLAPLIAEQRLTIWYSTPSILSLLAQYGRLERHDLSSIRTVLFAGEVFPVAQLRALKALLPAPSYFNLYGPTETNVCTYQEIPAAIPPDRVDPYPIGRTCEHLRSRVVDPEGSLLQAGQEGELLIAGPGIMSGYWNLPDQNASAFVVDPDGTRWYRTGDLVVEGSDGAYLFHGRRDRMVKRRGYRVELGEIEAGLATHPRVREVAVVAVPDSEAGVRINAFMSLDGPGRPSIVSLKQFCTERLPRYMIPDLFGFVESLPRTSTDKIDYLTLKGMGTR